MELKDSRIIGFIIPPTTSTKGELEEDINELAELSKSFVDNWSRKNEKEALIVSQKALKLLENIINKILRLRDDYRENNHPNERNLNKALKASVGQLYEGVKKKDKDSFTESKPGESILPSGFGPKVLTLEKALNKLKHRNVESMNFLISEPSGHQLVVFTHKAMGQPDAISVITIEDFCNACKVAAKAI